MPSEIVRMGDDQGYQVSEAEATWLRKQLERPGSLIMAQVPPAVPEKRTIHQRIVQAMRAVSHVTKDGYNEHFKYPFRGIDGVVNALGPALREAGVFPMEEVLDIGYRDTQTAKGDPAREVTVRVRITFHGEDGGYLETEGVGESIDHSDKGTAKAMSVARRVAYLGVFLLPTQEPTTDHDSHYHQRGGKPAMSDWERNAGLAFMRNPTPEEVAAASPEILAAALRQTLDFRACVEEHAAWQQPSEGEDSPTWEEHLGARIAWEVDHCATLADAQALWELLKAEQCDPVREGEHAAVRLKKRVVTLKAEQAKQVNDLTEEITSITVSDGFDELWGRAEALQEQGILTLDQVHDLGTVISDRRAKIQREQNQAVTA